MAAFWIYASARWCAAAEAEHRLCDRLLAFLGREQFRLNVDINVQYQAYETYQDVLPALLAGCGLFVGVIGSDWLDDLRTHRDADRGDSVAAEFETALSLELPMLLVLLGRDQPPSAEELPERLRKMAAAPTIRIRDDHFDADAMALLGMLRRRIDAFEAATETVADGVRPPQMVRIEPGSLLMGSAPGDPGAVETEFPQHRVRFARGFEIGAFAVTCEDFADYCAARGIPTPEPGGGDHGRLPVVDVSYFEAEACCRWLSRALGQQYRLPSEAEWEYCCRAGGGAPVANHEADGPAPVGSSAPNAWGLYEFGGNVWEYCADSWNESYDGAPTDGSAWLDGACDYVMRRGGSWRSGARKSRAANRCPYLRDVRAKDIGFRLARSL